MPISMQIQNLDKFYKRVLKILSGNEKIMTGGHKRSDNPNPLYHPPPPLFQSRAIIITQIIRPTFRTLSLT